MKTKSQKEHEEKKERKKEKQIEIIFGHIAFKLTKSRLNIDLFLFDIISSASSTVADPSTVTVRIESASTSDLNVQDVSTTSSSSDVDDDDDLRGQERQSNPNVRHSQRSSSAVHRQHSSKLGDHHHHHSVHHQKHPSRLSADATSPMRGNQSRPITAVSLPSKPSTYDNEWDLDTEQALVATIQRRNPSCPSISPTTVRSKTPSPSAVVPKLLLQQAPPVFTTTSECLGNSEQMKKCSEINLFFFHLEFLAGDDLRPQMRREMPKRSQSLVKPTIPISDPSSPTVPMVFLTDDIFLGSMRALQNERQLCRLSIDYLIDATNMRPDELARKANIGARLPCQCIHPHSRCTLTLEFDQAYLSGSPSSPSLSATTSAAMSMTAAASSTEASHMSNSKVRELSRSQLGKLFSAVNHFILKAQQEEKRILIYGFELTPNSPLAVIAIQYLMLVDEQMGLAEATQSVHRLFPVVPLKHQHYPTMEKRFQDYLKQLDKKTFPKNFIASRISGDGGSSSSGNDFRHSSRDLSWEPSELQSNTSTSLTSWTTIPMPIVNDHTHQPQRSFKTRSAWDTWTMSLAIDFLFSTIKQEKDLWWWSYRHSWVRAQERYCFEQHVSRRIPYVDRKDQLISEESDLTGQHEEMRNDVVPCPLITHIF